MNPLRSPGDGDGGGELDRIRRTLGERRELVVLAAVVASVLIAVAVARGGLGPGILVVGLVSGALIALHGAGIILVYRANRVINFSQIQIGLVAASLFVELVHRRLFLVAVATVCKPCLPAPETVGDLARAGGGPRTEALLSRSEVAESPSMRLDSNELRDLLPEGFSAVDFAVDVAPDWLVQLNYLLSFIVAVVVSGLLVWAVYRLVLKRFNEAPRLVLTVITIAAGSFTLTVGNFLIRNFLPAGSVAVETDGVGPSAAVPIDGTFSISPAVFGATDVAIVVIALAAALGLAWFLRHSRSGIVLRGTAENPRRAETLGVNVIAVTGRAWMIAGLLSGIGAALTVAQRGAGGVDTFDALVRALGAAVIGGLVGLPVTVVAGLTIGVMDQAVLFAAKSGSLVSGLLFIVIVALLIAQRARSGRADMEALSSWTSSRELRPTPRELRGLPPVRTAVRVLGGTAGVLALGYPWFMSPAQTTGATVILTYAIIGLSLLVLTGWAGQISLAQMGFAAIGAWVAAVLALPLPLAMVAGALAGAGTAALVGLPAMRLRGQHLAIASLALSVAISGILLTPEYLGRHLPPSLSRPVLLGIDFQDGRAYYYLTLLFLVGSLVFTMGLRRSRTARALIACKENEQAAQSFGINLLRARVGAFAVSGAMAAMAGVLFAYAELGVNRESFQPGRSVQLFLVALLGGFGATAGPILGALYLGLLDVLSAGVFQDLVEILLHPGLGVVVLLLAMPGGLAEGAFRIRDAWLRRVAMRYRIEVPSLFADRAVRNREVPITPKAARGGGETFVPTRYRLEGQWKMEHHRRERAGA